jgi:hypothetical protein
MTTAPVPAPTYWARFPSGNADRVLRRRLSQAALDRLRETVAQHIEWGVEPLPEPERA